MASDLRHLPLLFKPHPWHGIPIGDDAPRTVTCFIEIVPTDTVKYELDKETGYLKVDRPQKFSNVCPSLYGFIPQTYCGEQRRRLLRRAHRPQGIVGDGDPMDICVLTEKSISHGDIILRAIPIGGLRMIDGDEADDKIIAVLEDDAVYGGWREIDDAPHRAGRPPAALLPHLQAGPRRRPAAGRDHPCLRPRRSLRGDQPQPRRLRSALREVEREDREDDDVSTERHVHPFRPSSFVLRLPQGAPCPLSR